MKCRVCSSTNIKVKTDIYGLTPYKNIIGGSHKFKLDAGQGRTWHSNGQRFKYASLSDCYNQGLSDTLTAIRNQYGVTMVKKQFGQCHNCKYAMHLDSGKAYSIKP